jgi:hypothetical protein
VVILAALLGVLVVANLPLFVCMPLTDDAVLYDLQARNVLDGGVLYRDFLEPNLPGIVWSHIAFRSAFGFSSEALRVVDFALFGGIVWLLARWLRRTDLPATTSIGASILLFWFYFGLSEWCHCQRDMWMLLPALAALTLRFRQAGRLESTSPPRLSLFEWGMAEGALWAAAFWIKPHIAIPAITCLIVSAALSTAWRRVAVDWAGILAGGLVVGAAGISWLWGTGAWPYFMETMLDWNPRYVAAGNEHWTKLRFLAMLLRMFPWILLHLAAVPVAVWRLAPIVWRTAKKAGGANSNAGRGRMLLAAFYLGSVAHAFLLQHLFDYVHAPVVCLAIVTLAACLPSTSESRSHRLALTAFLFLAAIATPPISMTRLECWPRCFAEGSSPAVRDRLKHSTLNDFRSLADVRRFLAQRNLRDGDLVCFHNGLVSLYWELDTRPGTRYIFLESISVYFPDRHDQIIDSLNRSSHQYVVTNLIAGGMSERDAYAVGNAGPRAAPPAYPHKLRNAYPWSQSIIFRAGPYLVHRVRRPLGQIAVSVPRRRKHPRTSATTGAGVATALPADAANRSQR